MLSQQSQYHSISFENTKVAYCWASTKRDIVYCLVYGVTVHVRLWGYNLTWHDSPSLWREEVMRYYYWYLNFWLTSWKITRRVNDPMVNPQYRISFLGSNVHSRHICMANGPSVTERRIFEFIYFPINLHGVLN